MSSNLSYCRGIHREKQEVSLVVQRKKTSTLTKQEKRRRLHKEEMNRLENIQSKQQSSNRQIKRRMRESRYAVNKVQKQLKEQRVVKVQQRENSLRGVNALGEIDGSQLSALQSSKMPRQGLKAIAILKAKASKEAQEAKERQDAEDDEIIESFTSSDKSTIVPTESPAEPVAESPVAEPVVVSSTHGTCRLGYSIVC